MKFVKGMVIGAAAVTGKKKEKAIKGEESKKRVTRKKNESI